MIQAKIKLLNERARVPEFKTKEAACADLYSPHDCIVKPGETVTIPLGIALELPLGTQAKVLGRSGLARDYQIFVTTGTIDSDYRGEIGVILTNFGNKDYHIQVGHRIAQLDVMPMYKTEFEQVEKLTETSREGGFGSTGA